MQPPIPPLLCLPPLVPGSCHGSRAGYQPAPSTSDRTAVYREDLVGMRDQVGLCASALRALRDNPSDSPHSNKETFETFSRELSNLKARAESARKDYGRMDARAELFFGSWIEE